LGFQCLDSFGVTAGRCKDIYCYPLLPLHHSVVYTCQRTVIIIYEGGSGSCASRRSPRLSPANSNPGWHFIIYTPFSTAISNDNRHIAGYVMFLVVCDGNEGFDPDSLCSEALCFTYIDCHPSQEAAICSLNRSINIRTKSITLYS